MNIRLATAELLCLTLPAFGQGVDPYIGTWKLNTEKSTSTIPLPKSLNITWSKDGENTIITMDEIAANGRPLKIVWTANYEGEPRPTTGVPNFDSAAFTRVGNTINMVNFKNGEVVDIAQLGNVTDKTYTITAEGVTPNGVSYRFTYVWDRQ
jgi:hypothetical protein